MSLLIVTLVLFAVVCCGGSGCDGSLQPEKHVSLKRTSVDEPPQDGLSSETGSSLLAVETNGGYLSSPSEVRLQIINISSVLLTWSYHFRETTPPQVEFMVQCSHNGEPYINCSTLFNDMCYIYSGLEYAGYYKFRVVAYHLGLASEPKETYYFVNGITAPPGPPTDVKATAVSHSEISLQWERPTTPTPLHYIIKWGTNLSLLDMTVEVYKSIHYTITSLAPGRMYYFKIISDISGRLSVPSPIVNASTLIPAIMWSLGASVDFSCMDSTALPTLQLSHQNFTVSSRWISLSWMIPPLPLEVTNFTIYYSKQDGNSLLGQAHIDRDMFHSHWTVEPDLLNATITGLEPATAYIFCIGYFAGEFLSELSAPLDLKTLDGISCSVCKALSSSELLLQWKYFGSNEASTAQVFVSELPDWKQITEIKVNTSGDYQYSVSGLNPWSSHLFAITLNTVMVYDQCLFEGCRTEEAAPCEPPTNVTITEVTTQSIIVTWYPPPAASHNGIIQDYVIMYLCNSQCELQQLYNTKQVVVPADRQHMNTKLTGLSPFIECSIEIAARTRRGGYGPFSFKISVTTNEDVPSGLPTNIAVLKTTNHSLALSWGPPNPCHQNGNISGYSVYITEYFQTSMKFQYARRSFTINVSDTAIVVEPLPADTMYGVSIAARTGAGLGPCSLPLYATTVNSDGSTVHWNFKVVSIIMVCTAASLVLLGVVLLLAACLLKLFSDECTSSLPLISMDTHSPTQNDCTLYSDTTDDKQNSCQQEGSKINRNKIFIEHSAEELDRAFLLAVPKGSEFEKDGNSAPIHQYADIPDCCSVSTQSSLQLDSM